MDNDILDLPEFLERVQDDIELMLELFDLYTEDLRVKRLLLKEAIAKNDCEQIKNIGHSLKGSSGNISAKILRTTFLKFEEMGKNKDLTGAANLFVLMDEQFRDLLNRVGEVQKEFKK